jgi:hypothetical protein
VRDARRDEEVRKAEVQTIKELMSKRVAQQPQEYNKCQSWGEWDDCSEDSPPQHGVTISGNWYKADRDVLTAAGRSRYGTGIHFDDNHRVSCNIRVLSSMKGQRRRRQC